jgi:hypothetical protein
LLQETAIVIASCQPRQLECNHANDAHQQCGWQQHAEQAADRAVLQEKFNQLPTSAVTARDDQGLENEAGQKKSLKPGNHRRYRTAE